MCLSGIVDINGYTIKSVRKKYWKKETLIYIANKCILLNKELDSHSA